MNIDSLLSGKHAFIVGSIKDAQRVQQSLVESSIDFSQFYQSSLAILKRIKPTIIIYAGEDKPYFTRKQAHLLAKKLNIPLFDENQFCKQNLTYN